MKTKLYALCFMLYAFAIAPLAQSHAAPDLTATVAVEQTADTAFAAKTAAMNKARRQIFNTVLSRYADRVTVETLSSKMTDAELLNIIGMTSIADEKTSTTNYSANITMTLDPAAAQRWLSNNNVQNYMAAADDTGPRTTIFLEFSGGLNQWVDLNQGLRNAGFSDSDFKISSILGKNVTATVPANRRSAFVVALQNMGWSVSNADGILKARK